ncbi:sulfatase family protein [Chondrinema litorale]|uniref:sulfatase family protein n=1 Tax=Chondrinema litorale TaxID=2994555 RepID=UPI002543B78D|nr:sulfatase [Chondrinema litorale]UZR97108.1 sulfatase [Chondrinema litorale]
MMMKKAIFYLKLGFLSLLYACSTKQADERVNILFAISDDQSFYHTSYAGCTFVNTPAFDKIAREGVYFTNCYAGSPGCAPSRSTIVTGRFHWQNEQAGQHASSWPKKYVPFVDLLNGNGYYTGRTGKGVAPFRYARSEEDSLWRKEDAAGVERSHTLYEEGSDTDERTTTGIDKINYFDNFEYFMEHREKDKPFFFWYGSTEPHRDYEKDSWKRNGKSLKDVEVPEFLPDNEVIRRDLLDYAVEIEWFDSQLKRMLDYLEKIGELDNTIVIVTSDNGMPFPRAKANSFEYGVHVPLSIRYPKKFPGGRTVDGPVSFVDLAPTILEMTNTSQEGMLPITGKSMKAILESNKERDELKTDQYVFAGRERHSSSRYLNWGYPQRVIRSKEFLLIWNLKPERWPAGAPQRINPENENDLLPMYGIDENGVHHSDWAYTDIDPSPSKSFIVEHHDDEAVRPYFEWAVGKRPEFELYQVSKDPFCLKNLVGKDDYQHIETEMKEVLIQKLLSTKDPRVAGDNPDLFDSYKRYSHMRSFPNSLISIKSI